MKNDELYSLTTYKQYFNNYISNILIVIVNLVSLDESEILGIFSGNIEPACFSKVKYRNLLNYKPTLFENMNLLKKISDNKYKVYIYNTILSSNINIIHYKPTTSNTSLNPCSKYDCPFKSYMKHGTYTLVDSSGKLITTPPTIINETIGWNERNYITDSMSLNKIKLYPCANISDLQKAIKYSSKHKHSLNIRGGANSYANFSMRKGHILVFTKLFSSTIDKSITESFHKILLIDTKLYIGNNIRLGEVYLYLHNRRIATGTSFDFPGGTCGNVGVAGYTLGGGQSFIGSYTGPCCHYLYGVKYVDAFGNYKTHINEDTHPETMYVLRGGGQIKPFVVTEFIFDLSGLESSKWYWKQVVFSSLESNNVVQTILKYIHTNLKNDTVLGVMNIHTQNSIDFIGMTVNFLSKNEPVEKHPSYIKFYNSIIEFLKKNKKCSITISGNDIGLYLYELYNTENPCCGNWAGTISTMWEWNDNPNHRNSSYYNYTVSRTWSSIMGTELHLKDVQNNILKNSFIGLDHYVSSTTGGPYKNKSVFPPYSDFTGWTMQLYTSDNYTNTNVEDALTNILSISGDIVQYKYPNYPPTYKLNNSNQYNNLHLYFDISNIYVINKIKQQYDPSNMFVSDYDIY